jgi:lipopolysaccharide export system protein LptA
VTFEVGGRAGTKVFAENMHYFASEEAWVITGGLPIDFLDAFARGDTLTIRNGKGEEAVSFGLSGSAKAVQALRPICGS